MSDKSVMSWHGCNKAMLFLCGLLSLWVAMPAWAQTYGLRSQRQIHLFDFEEARLGNFEQMPQHWYAIGRPAFSADPNFMRTTLHEELVRRPGYPQFTEVGFDRPQHEAGPHAFALRLDGGHVGAFLEVGALPAVPMSDYRVTARVRTAGLKRAGARMTAYFVDGQGRRIDASVSHSPLIRTHDDWQTISLPLHGEFTQAAWIGLEVEALQPQPDPDSPLGREQILLEDIQGQVLWDDIAIWQLPQVSLGTQSRVNILREPTRPEVVVNVRDLTGQTLMAQIDLYDAQGQKVDHTQRAFGQGQSTRWVWTPRLERFGWYVADLTVYDAGQAGESLLDGEIARSLVSFLWLPEQEETGLEAVRADYQRFVLNAADLPTGQMSAMPLMLKQAGVDSVVYSLWERATTLATLSQRQHALDDAINPVVAQGGQVMLSMNPAPTELLHKLDLPDAGLLGLWEKDRSIWQPYMLSLLMRHGQSVSRWKLGDATTGMEPMLRDLPERTRLAYQGLQTMAPRPRVMLAWNLMYPRRGDMPASTQYWMEVPHQIQAEYLGLYLLSWRGRPAPETWLMLREPEPDQMSHDRRLTDLSLRMIHAWEAGATGLAIDKPWGWASSRQQTLMPDSLLGAFGQISQRLAGRRAVGRLDAGPGLVCIIFDGPAGGMLAVWNRSSEDKMLSMYLGQSPEMVDLWGNRQKLSLAGGRHHVPLSNRPVFIEGIDAKLAVMRSQFKLDEPFVESTQQPHHRVLTLVNPWPRTMTGDVQIVGPEDWRIQPRQTHFSIAPGQSIRVPVRIVFPVSEVAGYKRLEARVSFTADQPYQADFYAPMTLGLRNIQFDASVSYQAGQQAGQVNAVVTQFISNQGDEPVSLYAFVQSTGFARQEGIISRLMPGQSIIRRFVLQDITRHGPLDQPLRVGLRETKGPAVLNKLLTLRTPAMGEVSSGRP